MPGYTWVGSVVRGAKITNELIEEMRTHGDTIATWNLARNPAPSACASYNSWLQPLVGDSTSVNAIFDELQRNLDYLKTNDWCRGYTATAHIAQHSTKELSNNTAQYSPACSQCVAQGSG
jgi:hypothetical protein